MRELRRLELSVEYCGESPPPRAPEVADMLEELARALFLTVDEPPPQAVADEAAAHEELAAFFLAVLCEVGTNLWRLREKMVGPQGREPLADMRRAYRHLEAAFDTLAQAGIDIHDHTNEPVPEGGVYALKVVAYEPTPGLSREHVIETIKPTVSFRRRIIQMGEVVIGTPPAAG